MFRVRIQAVLVLTLIFSVIGQAWALELRNRVDVKVSAEVRDDLDRNLQVYRYQISNSQAAAQKVWNFQLIMQTDGLVQDVVAPPGWARPSLKAKGTGHTADLRAVARANWSAPEKARIVPGATLTGFEATATASLPGIVDYYAEGYARPPQLPPGKVSPGPIPGYDDVTPYGPGVVGRTIGPVSLDNPFSPVEFVDHLISLKDEAVELDWIRNAGFIQGLDARLEAVNIALLAQRDNIARDTLRALLGEFEQQRGKAITPEAYGLLKYNIEYLVLQLAKAQ